MALYHNPLNDRAFLKELDKNRNREIYARIILLTFEEQPIERIEGKVTGGSINIDGASAIRRSCSLTMTTQDQNINIFYLGLERKFTLEIGLKNTIEPDYPEVIWFNQGMFVTTGVTTSTQATNYTINISGKDKGCLINGEVGGSLPSSIDFGMVEQYDESGTRITYEHIILRDIIKNMLETYGNELPHNIVINDLDEDSLELLEYRGDTPLYIFKNDNSCTNITLNGSQIVYVQNDVSKEFTVPVRLSSFGTGNYKLDAFTEMAGSDGQVSPTKVTQSPRGKEIYTIVKMQAGESIGYRKTDLVYAGDLIANVGETVTSVLDKIKNMLVNYEYFYDLDGRFIFQRKKTFTHSEWLSEKIDLVTNETYYENNKIIAENFYSFEDNELVINFNNTPSIQDIKNDFSIWGVRKSSTGAEIPIHLRYAIDTKPTIYTTYKDIGGQQYTFIANNSNVFSWDNNVIYCDWRELIYQMAFDYFKYKDTKEDFYYQVENNNLDNGITRYPGGRTGYEQYYTDLQGFWRELYAPDLQNFNATSKGEISKGGFFTQILLSTNTYRRNKFYIRYFDDYDKEKRFPKYKLSSTRVYNEDTIYYEKTENETSIFTRNQVETPNLLNFWFDFLDSSGDIGRFSVKAIGQRPKNVNNTKLTSIYYRSIPNLIFETEEENSVKNSAYSYITMTQNLENCLSVSDRGKSAWEEMQAYLNDYTYAKESVSFTTIPIYYLQPNEQVSIKDSESKINGEYIINKITVPLTYNGTMSITATKKVDAIY